MAQTPLTDAAPYYNGEALIFELRQNYCRDTVTVATAAGKVGPCKVMGKITASGKYVPLAPAANDGSQNAAGVLVNRVDATAADAKGQIWARGPVELNKSELDFGAADAGQIATAITQLKALGILVVDAI